MPRVKKKDYEKLTDSNIQRVIDMMAMSTTDKKPMTKKEACELLNISYNTQRLNKIIEEFEDRKEFTAKRRAQNRGKPASKDEIKIVAESYLEGASVSEIAKMLFRSPAFVKSIIDTIGIPAKRLAEDLEVGLLPEECVSEEFTPGEIVWSAQYNSAARIIREDTAIDYEAKYGSKCYRIYVMEPLVHNPDSYFGDVPGGFNAAQCAHDLGKLAHLSAYGLNLNRLEGA